MMRAEPGFAAVRARHEAWVEERLRLLPEPHRSIVAEEPVEALKRAQVMVRQVAEEREFLERARESWRLQFGEVARRAWRETHEGAEPWWAQVISPERPDSAAQADAEYGAFIRGLAQREQIRSGPGAR